ncbi:MAG: PEP-CTERM sorting domain-containing protein, partial [Alphaproteobacteria bacterium]
LANPVNRVWACVLASAPQPASCAQTPALGNLQPRFNLKRSGSSFSAFNPGGPEVGISIDDPLMQAGSFSSFMSGPDIIHDAHACSVGFKGESGAFVFSPTTCGVRTPDHNATELYINLASLIPGTSLNLHYSIGISADFAFVAVPEPSSLSLLLLAVASLAAFGFGSRRMIEGRSASYLSVKQ